MITPYQNQLLLLHKQIRLESLENCEKDLNSLTEIKESLAKDTTKHIDPEAEGVKLNQAYTLVKINIKRLKTEIKLVESVLSNQLKQYQVGFNVLKEMMGISLESVEEMTQSGNMTEMDYIKMGKVSMDLIKFYEQIGNAQFNLIPRH
jgi:hypothetical protein